MISGSFGDNGELLFEIELVAANNDKFSVEALLDTGFTDGWLAINTQDLEVLEWSRLRKNIFHRGMLNPNMLLSKLQTLEQILQIMVNLNRANSAANQPMGAVRVKVKLTNAIDEALVSRGMLNPNMLRVYETEALVDTGAVRTVLPMSIVQQLGLRIRGQQIAQYANGSEESIGVTEPVIIELAGRETTEATLVTGDIVLLGQAVLETLDLLVDCRNQRLIPNPEPNYPVMRI
jgi:clan AA aspartic protease